MTKKIFLMFLSIFLSVTYLSAQVVLTVDVPTAGGLANAIGSDLKTVTDLTLTGTINAADFQTIKQMTALKNLDMSGVNVVENSSFRRFFSGKTYHVILPKTMVNLPDETFYVFLGSVTLPKGLKTIGSGCFTASKLTQDLVLPSGLEVIGNGAFNRMGSKVDFSQVKTSLTTIGNNFLESYSGSSEIDFSDFTSLTNMRRAFTGYWGHVILPKTMVNLPDETFYVFSGSVTLPKGLKTIGAGCFVASSIKKIELPSSVNLIGNEAFSRASQLSKIVSNNPTPPSLGRNVFGGVNKQTTVLEVPIESLSLYGTADQWKDFLNVNVTIPQEIKLHYSIGNSHDAGDKKPDGGFNTYQYGSIEADYKAIRIGEYYWMTQNFNHEEPSRFTWSQGQVSGIETKYPMSQEVINKYLDIVDIDKSQYQVDIAKFTKDYGVYYSWDSRKYMQKWGKMFENNSTQNNPAWKLPSVKDFRQLIAMSDFRHYVKSDILQSRDFLYTFAPSLESNDMSQYQFDLKTGCYDPNTNQYTTTDWYGIKYGLQDKYGFNLMLGGSRFNQVDSGNYFEWYTAKCDGSTLTVPWVQTGDLYHLFYTTELAASDGMFNLHDFMDTYGGEYYHWMPIRWCRVLTDEELGYKLYVNIKNLDKNSAEWTSLQSGNEIPLLLKYRYTDFDRSQVSVVKLDLNESAPEGYIELPHGYIRGFYVHYLLDNPNPTVDMTKIITYACQVDDGVLMKEKPIVAPGTQGELQKVATRSIDSNNLVVPFKTDATVTLYPNPVQDVLNISGDNVEKVSVYDMTGRQVITAKNSNTISVSDLKTGTYIVKVLTANGESTHKVMKK